MKTRAALMIILLALLAPFEARAGFVDALTGKNGGAAPDGSYPGLINTAPAAQGGGQQVSPQKAYQTYLAQQNARKAANGAWNAQRNETARIATERAAEEKRLKELQQARAAEAYQEAEEAAPSGMGGYAEAPAAPFETAAEPADFQPPAPQAAGYPYTSD